MSNTAKIVQLHAVPAGRPVSMERALHTGLLPLREQARLFLQQALQGVFDAADDSLFEMAERAATNAEQQALFESMRIVRLQRQGVEQRMLEGLDQAFGDIAAERHRAFVDVLPAGVLTLLGNDELEESVAVKTMVMRSLSENGEAFSHLQQRMQALLGLPLTEDNNPLAARLLCTLILDALRPLGLSIQVRLLLLKLYEKHLLKDVGSLYDELNEQLIAAGILPNLLQSTPRPAARARSSAQAPTESAAQEAPAAVLGQLRELLGQAQGGAPVPEDAVPVTQSDLTRLLSFLQRQPPSAATGGNLRQQLDALLARASANSSRPRVIGKLDEDVITLVSMLFEKVLDDESLPGPMKEPIGSLQVPLLKAAILDQQLFGEQAHPARQLLNEVTVAARGSEDLAGLQRDRLLHKIEQVAQRLRDEFTDDPRVFADILEDFSLFNASEHKRAALLEQRLLEAEEARALRERARQQVDKLLSERLQGLTLPAAIVQVLERGWGGLLQLILLREGDGTAEWNQTLATLDELLERVAPLRTPEQARLLLDPRRNELLAELRRGLELVAYDPFEQQRFFHELTLWQRQLLKSFRGGAEAAKAMPLETMAADLPDEASAAASDEPAEAVVANAVVLEQVVEAAVTAELQPAVAAEEPQFAAWERAAEVAVELVELAAAAEPTASVESVAPIVPALPLETIEPLESCTAELEPAVGEEHLALVDNLGVGSWVELIAEDGAKQRCKLAAFIRVSGQFIFVNRAGAKVAAFGRLELAQTFARGAARLMDNAQPFDRALQAIIGNLRELRGE